MPEKILIVEDETALRETLAYTLQKEGYETHAVPDGNLAVAEARTFHPNLILLDIMLPGTDGFEVCRRIRQESTVPILMVTARGNEIDRVVGLEVGADDYLIKPFHMRELVARIKAHLRRIQMIRDEAIAPPEKDSASVPPLQFGNLRVDAIRGEAQLDGQALELKPKEFELLDHFARHRGQALTREQILQQVWGWEYLGDSRTVDVHVRWLREKIEPDPSNPVRLVTVRGVGYRFEG